MEIIEHVSEKDREIFFLEFVATAIAMKLENYYERSNHA